MLNATLVVNFVFKISNYNKVWFWYSTHVYFETIRDYYFVWNFNACRLFEI